MIHSSIAGPGVTQDDLRYHQYQYFSFNDTTIMAFVEIPKTETKSKTIDISLERNQSHLIFNF